MTETELGAQVRAALHEQGVHMWRNNTGRLQDITGRWVTFGLGIGSPDLVGVHPLIVTPEMVGTKLGVFRAIELKTTRSLTPDQQAWRTLLRSLGALYSVLKPGDDPTGPFPPATR